MVTAAIANQETFITQKKLVSAPGLAEASIAALIDRLVYVNKDKLAVTQRIHPQL